MRLRSIDKDRAANNLVIFQKLQAACAILYSFSILMHAFLRRQNIHPFTHVGWGRERIGMSYMVFIVAICLWHSARAPQRFLSGYVLNIGMAVVYLSIFYRTYWQGAAYFAAFTLLNSFLMVHVQPRSNRTLQMLLSLCSLFSFCLCVWFVQFSFFGAGN